MAKSVKVDADAFKAAVRVLLNTPPTPATAIEGKRPRKADAKKPGPQKRGGSGSGGTRLPHHS